MNLAQSKFHFIGIGGIGMCGLAELLHGIGSEVTGSDPARNAQVEHLQKLGVRVFHEHSADNLGDADVVVFSSAIKPGHVELEAARAAKIPIIPRAEALAELMRLKRGIAIAGNHGKTTTTSLMASVFLAAQQDPTAVVGGRLQELGSTAVLGKGQWLIAEADESDGSFSKLSPEIVVITNIDNDHLDHYGSFARLKEAFLQFASQIPFYGQAIICGDDPVILEVFTQFPKNSRSYGFSAENDYHVEGIKDEWRVSFQGEPLGTFKFSMPGRYNVLNATAAIAAAIEAGLSFAQAKIGIERFSGVDRRAQKKGDANGITVFDDYGHHPTELHAVLKGFRESFSDRRLIVYFQPHRYSRTQSCWSQFLDCFGNADVLFVGDIYPAGESPIEGVSSERLVEKIVHDQKTYLASPELAIETICENLREGDIFLTLGAGDGWKIGQEILEKYGN